MNHISQRLLRAADYVRSLGYSPAYVSLHGSQNYGLALDSEIYRSDYDFKCIVLPSLWELTEEGRFASLTVEFEGGQIDIKDMRLFAKLIENMNPAYLECLLTPHAMALEGGEQIRGMQALLPELFAQRGAKFAHVCCKLFAEKEKRMCHLSPAQAENIAKYGYDLKQAHHMYRLLVTLRCYEHTGCMQLLAPEREKALLLDLKQGEMPLEDVLKMAADWHLEIQTIAERIACRNGKDREQAAKQIKRLAKMAVYEHCRKEAKEDDGQSPV